MRAAITVRQYRTIRRLSRALQKSEDEITILKVHNAYLTERLALLRDLTYQRDQALALVVDVKWDLAVADQAIAWLMTATPTDLRELDVLEEEADG